jgi:aspartyl-tRNA(Asn)/glutamyl-tRNA(Gln) amidotransferase subunit A
MDEVAELSITALAEAIRTRTVSPVEAVRAALDRIASRPELNAFITVVGEQATESARQAEREVSEGTPRGPLHGIPFSVKDLTNTAGVRTTMGSRLFVDNVPTEDAVAVARLKAAGAILIGKTTTPEFGHKPFTESPLFGRTLNPFDSARTCGGSSGGAAVAVQAGMGPLALGTDGGGSIRIPASCCGIVGLKATLGAIPNLQAPDMFGANSYVGPMARRVVDVALAFDVLRGPDHRDPYGQGAHPTGIRTKPLEGLRIAWLPRCGSPAIDPEVAALTETAVRLMEDLGARVEEVSLDLAALEGAFLVFLESGLAARLRGRLPGREADVAPSLLVSVEKGMSHSAVALQDAAAARTDMFRRMTTLFDSFDLLVSPTVTAPPLLADQDPHGRVIIDNRDAGTIRGAWYPFTFPMNLTGHPALSMPCGFTAGNLPVGLQIAGPWHSEDMILGAAEALEEALTLPHRMA